MAVAYAVEDGVAVLTIDFPPVNALSAAVRAGLVEGVRAAAADPAVQAVVLACAGRTFVAGADISEFGKPPQPPLLADVLASVEGSDKPVVAAIHGTAFGGGLELALAAHARVAVASAKLGLPEVKLGLIPGGGGTQRLPRLVGASRALAMIVSGEPVGAETAKADGLVDAIAPEGELRPAAIALARSLAGRAPRRTRDLPAPAADAAAFEAARASARKARRGEAPLVAVEAVEAATRRAFDAGLAEERRLFERLRDGPESAALRHLFFAEREAAKVPGLAPDLTGPAIERVGVVGAGTMGQGIAMAFAAAGIPVLLAEANAEALARGLAAIKATLERAAKSGRMTPSEAEARATRIVGAEGLEGLGEADLVVEAVFEDLAVKTEVFRRLDQVLKPGAILASNTSYLDIDALAAATGRPGQVVGLHFFSPAHVMKLVEVVRTRATSDETLTAAMRLAKRLGKIGVVSGVCHGFIANRTQAQRQRQANRLIVEGAAPADVDRVLTGFGLPMGPFAMLDMAGLDIGWSPGKPAATVRDRLCEMGRKGIKTGAGFYDYGEDKQPRPSPVVDQAILDFAAREGVSRRAISDAEILDRCLLPIVNEGAKILDEGIAQRPSDIDVVWVHGYGWPAWRGGPMWWADDIGLAPVLEKLESYADRFGGDVAPAALIRRLASEGRGFRDL